MTVWPEGRMEFVCTVPAEEGKREERWLGELKVRSYGPGMAGLLFMGGTAVSMQCSGNI